MSARVIDEAGNSASRGVGYKSVSKYLAEASPVLVNRNEADLERAMFLIQRSYELSWCVFVWFGWVCK